MLFGHKGKNGKCNHLIYFTELNGKIAAHWHGRWLFYLFIRNMKFD